MNHQNLKQKSRKRKHSSKNIALFRKQIKRSDWDSLYNNENIEAEFSIFIKTLVSTFQKCFPIEIINLNHNNRNPWINQTLKDDIKKILIFVKSEVSYYGKQTKIQTIQKSKS